MVSPIQTPGITRRPARIRFNPHQAPGFPIFPHGYANRAEIALGAKGDSLFETNVSTQLVVFSFSPCLHSASNLAYCSGVRIVFASRMYFASLASLQPSFSCCAITASILVFCSDVRLRL